MDMAPAQAAQPCAPCLLPWEMGNMGSNLTAASATVVLCPSLAPFSCAGEGRKYLFRLSLLMSRQVPLNGSYIYVLYI